jgi:M6 family metalloprotease-like protein
MHDDRVALARPRLRSTVVMGCCIAAGFALASPVGAMEPFRPGEAERLMATGELSKRLEFAYRIGNHQVDERLVQNLRRQILRLRGLELNAPPGGQGMPASGSVHIFALLIEFNDYTHSVADTTINSMLFGTGDPADYPRESLARYYDRSSYGLLDLSGGATLGWYRTAYDRSAVATTTAGRESLIKEALDHYDGLGHDFSQYDNDGDGDIDYFVVMWTGPDTGWGTFWWGYQPGWTDASYTLDGKKLTKYSWQWESDSPVVVIHETGHGLGLPDLYDYDPATGPGTGVGGFDMMDGNAWDHNCFSKWMLEWLTPTVVPAGRQALTLKPTATDRDAVLIWPGIGLGDMFQEFFMVQNRQAVNNDALRFAPDHLPPDGLSIWHIDSTLSGGGFAYNNSNTSHKLIRLMEADGLEEIEAFACCQGCSCHVADSTDLYGEGDRFSQVTTPASTKYDGTDSCVTVCGIDDLGGSPADISARFSTVCSGAPTCLAGGPYTAECQGVTTSIDLTALGTTDPDAGETFTYAWTTDCPGGVFDDPTSATPRLTVSTSSCAASCSVSVVVTDCAGNSDSCASSVQVVDTLPPTVTCPPATTVECTGSCGTPASDPQLAPFFAAAQASDGCDPNLLFSNDAPPFLPLGQTPVTYTAVDDCSNTASCVSTVDVADTIPPTIHVQLDRDRLWPPNHKMAPIHAAVTVADGCDPAPHFVLTSITSNEPDNGLGDGDQPGDIQGASTGTPDVDFMLRAERSGTGGGRVYTVVYTVTGCSGDSSTASATVVVPHH